MPAKDLIHDVVIRALEKTGWRVERQHYKLNLPERTLFIDVLVKNPDTNERCLVEIKSFDETMSQSEVIANAIGKYQLYRQALSILGSQLPLSMAVPETAYNGVLSESWLKPLLDELQIRWIVVNIETEDIVLWT